MSDKEIKVLLVDDDEDEFIFIRDLLGEVKNSKFQIQWETDFDQARSKILDHFYDVYLVDYRLGKKTGLELIQEAKDEAVIAPFILLTGFGDVEVDEKALKMGAADYLVKDQLSAEVLARSIRYSLSHCRDLRELREREQSMSKLFNSTFEGVVVHSPQGEIMDANEMAIKILGKGKADLIGDDFYKYLDSENHNEIVASLQSGSELIYEATGLRNKEKVFPLEVLSKSYLYHGKVARLTSFRDLSERKYMEQQILHQDRLASAGLIASSLAHEIGTPMATIRGRAELVEMAAKGNDKVLANVRIIMTQIDRVSKLLKTLLNLTRKEVPDKVSPVNIHDMLADVMNLVAHDFSKLKVEIRNNVSSDMVCQAEVEPLHQVFINLFVNSLHAIQEAVDKGRLEGHYVDISGNKGDDWCELSFEDTGCGISPKNMRHLFKPFFTTKDVGQGTGLGLATTYKIIDSFGGKISVDSELGKGTKFTIQLKTK